MGGLKSIKQGALNVVHFVAIAFAYCLSQIMVLLILAFLQFILWIALGLVMRQMFGTTDIGVNNPDVSNYIAWGVVFVVYAAEWFVIWCAVCNGGIRWFYWKVLFSTLPLIFVLLKFNPEPDPMAMIPVTMTDIKFEFSTLVTGIILFPLYSIGIYKFILGEQQKSLRRRNTVYLCLTMLFLGLLFFIISWELMSSIYPIH